MKISIALATYNGAQYISEQLASIQKQTLLPDELVISDDCSTDDTVSIIKSFARKAPFKVKLLVNQKNQGVTQNFNNALLATTGDITFLCDQDDVWFDNKLKVMKEFVKNNSSYLLFMNDAMITNKYLEPTGMSKYDQINNAKIGMDSFVMGCCCCIKRELLEYCLPIPNGLSAHDDWLVNIADGLGKKITTTSILQYYRRHENNESHFLGNNLKKLNRFSVYLRSISDYIFNKEKDLEATLREQKIFLSGLYSIRNIIPKSDLISLDKLIEKQSGNAKFLMKRIQVRDRFILIRIILIFQMYMKDYPKKNRLAHAARDLLGK
jgi:glycosyltransferase involved in cell wall biosynthesis